MEEQVSSHLSDLEGLNSELEGFLADLHGREETLAARVKGLEEQLSAAKAGAASELKLLVQREAGLNASVEELRASLAREGAKLISLTAEREDLSRRLDAASRQLDETRTSLSGKLEVLSERFEEARSAVAQKEGLLKEARAAAKEEAARFAAALEQARAALSAESAKLSAAALDRDDLARRLQAAGELIEESKAALADRDALLKETRAAARETAAGLGADLDKARAAIQEGAKRISALVSERDALLGKLKEAEQQLQDEKEISEKKELMLAEAKAVARGKAAEFKAAVEQLKGAVAEANARAEAMVSERDSLLRRLEAGEKLLEGEKARSAEKEQLINAGRAAFKAKEDEIEKILRSAEELKADLALERATVKDKEAQLQKAARLREGLEKKLDLAAQENSRSEEGFLLKVELVKKEMREQAHRAEELERKLAAAGARLDDALDEASRKEKLLAETAAALADKEAQLKETNQKLTELTKEFAEIKSGALQENAARARETAAALAARVEELENSLSENASRHMEKFRAVQAELSAAKAEIRAKAEENASLLAREDTISKELGDAEEKWKFATAQLNNSASKLRNAENELEIIQGRMKSLEEERDKFRAAAIKAETAASALAAQEARARDGEAAGLIAALEEQSAKYTELLRKYDDIVLVNEALAREKAGVKAEADALKSALKAAQDAADADAGETRGERSGLIGKVRDLEIDLKKKSFELEAARAAAETSAREAEELRSRLDETDTARAGESEVERARYAALSERAHNAEVLLKRKEFELEEVRAAAETSALEAEKLRSRLEEKEDAAAGEAEAERARYAVLSEKMHNAEALLKRKEFELEEAKGALAGLEGECAMLRDSRAALGEKYAREIHAENELLKEAQSRIAERDSVISRLSSAEEQLKKESEALRKEKQDLLSLVRKKAAGAAHSAKVSEAERMLAEKESRLVKLRAELENTRAEKAELQGREKELREELKARPYRAMLREAEEKLLIKEKMLAEVNSRMHKIGRDFEELKVRGQSAGAPGYLPDFEELMAGVAHQVANSISIIRSHAEFCAEAPEAEGARESLDVIVRNIVSLQKKIDIIMNFSRPVIPQRSPEKLSAVIAEALDGLRSSGRLEKIKVRVRGGEKLKPVSLDRVRFAAAVEQVLLNAAEAMPEGGELAVTVSAAAGRQRVEISDTGPGIERKNLGSVFHPFFTTRPGRMGLGLTLARNVARAHGGSLELSSEPGKGTKVQIELPEIS